MFGGFFVCCCFGVFCCFFLLFLVFVVVFVVVVFLLFCCCFFNYVKIGKSSRDEVRKLTGISVSRRYEKQLVLPLSCISSCARDKRVYQPPPPPPLWPCQHRKYLPTELQLLPLLLQGTRHQTTPVHENGQKLRNYTYTNRMSVLQQETHRCNCLLTPKNFKRT